MESIDSTQQPLQIPQGTEIRSADDEKLGKIVAAERGYLVVEKGFVFPTDYYIPTTAIASYDGKRAYLTLNKDEVLHQGWDRIPDAAATADAGMADRSARSTTIEGKDRVSVPVHEEELTATTRPVEYGQVQVQKDVVTEQRSIDVPVTEERVRVTRRAVDRPGAEAGAFEEGTVSVPVRGEAVDVQKQVRVAEEVELAKEQVQRTERIDDTVRRERVNVDDAGMGTTHATTGGWAPSRATDYAALVGKDVYSAEGDKVGTITRVGSPSGAFQAGVGRHSFLLDPGTLRDWFGGYDEVYLPESAIAGLSGDRVNLSYTKDQIKSAGWTTKPTDYDAYTWR